MRFSGGTLVRKYFIFLNQDAENPTIFMRVIYIIFEAIMGINEVNPLQLELELHPPFILSLPFPELIMSTLYDVCNTH